MIISHQWDKHLGCPPYKILENILKDDDEITSTICQKTRKNNDDA